MDEESLDRLVTGRGLKSKPKTNVQVVREFSVPWVLAMEPGTQFDFEDAGRCPETRWYSTTTGRFMMRSDRSWSS